MTPLAQRIARELTLPIKNRSFDPPSFPRRLSDVHCFEVTDVAELSMEISDRPEQFGASELITFLPAPKTWIEWKEADGTRKGILLEEAAGPKAHGETCSIVMASWVGLCEHPDNRYFGSVDQKFVDLARGPFHDAGNNEDGGPLLKAGYRKFGDGWMPENRLAAFLLIINSPRVIGRRQYMPHRGLERRLLRAAPMIGKFPLHAWTEIKLEISRQDMSDDDAAEAHLTGKRALHFCRAHVRIRLGRLEIVRSHWRGDASLGIKRSRYKVTA